MAKVRNHKAKPTNITNEVNEDVIVDLELLDEGSVGGHTESLPVAVQPQAVVLDTDIKVRILTNLEKLSYDGESQFVEEFNKLVDLDAYDPDDPEAAAKLTIAALAKTITNLLPAAEEAFRDRPNEKTVVPLDRLTTLFRELMTESRRLRDYEKQGDIILAHISAFMRRVSASFVDHIYEVKAAVGTIDDKTAQREVLNALRDSSTKYSNHVAACLDSLQGEIQGMFRAGRRK